MRRPSVRTGNRLVTTLFVAALSLTPVSRSLADLRHEYLFNSGNGTEIIDSVGTAHGTVVGTTIIPADSRLQLGGGEQYGNLPASTIAINTFNELTLEMWLTVDPANNNIFTAAAAFGTTLESGFGSNYFMMQPTRATNQSSAQITAVGGGDEAFVGGPQLANGGLRHIAATVDSTQIAYYIDGALQGTTLLSTPGTPASLASLSNDFAYIGNSVWAFDPTLIGSIFEMRIYDDAKDATEVATLFTEGCVDGCGGDLYLEVDRDTGAARLINDLSDRNLVIYSITSANGALRPNADGWNPITDSGLDPTDAWEILVDSRTQLSEQDPLPNGDNDGILLTAGSPIPLGNIWTQSPFEDVQMNITYLDGNFVEQTDSLPVRFINGIDDQPFARGDLNLDGSINVTDFNIFMSNHLEDFAMTIGATLPIDTFAFGDMNGDLVNDYLDFRAFKAEYVQANGAAAFQALVSGQPVPEPKSLVLVALGMLGAGLAAGWRKLFNVQKGLPDNLWKTQWRYSELRSTTLSALAATLVAYAGMAQAQQIVVAETFDTRVDTTAFGVEGATTLTLIDQGGGDNALQFTSTATGAFFAAGFNSLAPLEVEPSPGGPNISGNLADYQLSFDLTINAINGFIPNLEIWIADGPRFGMNSARLYTAGGLVDGMQTISFPLSQAANTSPNGFTNGGDPFTPEADDWWLQMNTISFGTTVGASVDYTIDNFQVTIDIADSLALVVDPVDGDTMIRNITSEPITFDYYRIESLEDGALITDDYDPQSDTGWNSLADQQRDSVGPGVDGNWAEVTSVNSANQLVENFILGATTLAGGQQIYLGAPVDPGLLGDTAGNPLKLLFGGDAYPALALGSVVFENVEPPMGLPGDFNDDGVVDAADYTTWRDNLGLSESLLPDGSTDGSGFIDAEDLNLWKMNFGAPGAANLSAASASSVPEPSTYFTAIATLLVLGVGRRTRCSNS